MENDYGELKKIYKPAHRLGLYAIVVARDLQAEQVELSLALQETQERNRSSLPDIMDDLTARQDARSVLAQIAARMRDIPTELVAVEQEVAESSQRLGALIMPSLVMARR